jgi:ADP-ribose pyrophosphatase YjhB (NUDIX family)
VLVAPEAGLDDRGRGQGRDVEHAAPPREVRDGPADAGVGHLHDQPDVGAQPAHQQSRLQRVEIVLLDADDGRRPGQAGRVERLRQAGAAEDARDLPGVDGRRPGREVLVLHDPDRDAREVELFHGAQRDAVQPDHDHVAGPAARVGEHGAVSRARVSCDVARPRAAGPADHRATYPGPMPVRVPCVGAVIHDDEHRLLVVRRANPPAIGRWSIPGGRVESDESDAEAVRREVLEETGLVVAVGMWVGTVEIPGIGGAVYDIRDYACSVVDGTLVAGDDASDARWVTRAELLQLDTVRDLVDTLAGWGVLPA